MRITCQRRELYRALRRLMHAIPTRSTLPILQHVLIETPGAGRLRLSATNLEVGISCLIEAVVEQEGSVAVPALPLLAFLKRSSGEERATLRTGNAPPLEDRARTFLLVDDLVEFPCMDAAGFPRVRGPAEAAITVRCPARLLREVVAQVAFAASPAARDTILSNVWLQVDGKTAAFAASNGSHCALRTVSGAGSQAREELLLVPAHALAAIARLLPRQGEAQVEVAPHKGLLCIRADGWEFLARLTDPGVRSFSADDPVAQHTRNGKSRPFEQYVPKNPKTLVVLSKKDLQAVLSKRAWPVSCSLQREGEGAHLVFKVYGKEEVTTHAIPVQCCGPSFPTVWLNMRLLADALSCPGTTASLVLGFGSPHTDAIVLRWLDADGGMRQTYSYVMMPLNPLGVLQHRHVRRALPALPLQFLSQTCGRTEQAPEARAITRVREETISLLASMLALGLVPTEAAIQESVQRVKQLAVRPEKILLELFKKHGGEIAQMLAVAAFEPGGSSLEIAGGQLAFDARQVQTALAKANGGCLRNSDDGGDTAGSGAP
jgi:hypothetical protein